MASPENIRLLYVQRVFLQRDSGLMLFNARKGIKAVGCDVNLDEVLQTARQFKPHVLYYGVGAEDRLGLEIVRAVHSQFREVKIVIVETALVSPLILDFLRAGVAGFVDRNSTFAEAVATLRAVAQGKRVFPRVLPESMIPEIIELVPPIKEALTSEESSVLTDRQKEIVRLIGEGHPNKEIASELGVSIHTVKSHIRGVLERLQLSSRLEIACFANHIISSPKNQ